MNCHDVEPFLDQLGATYDGGVIPNEASLRQHLASCSACQQSLQLMERWDSQLSRAMVDVAIPDGLSDRLIVALKTTPPVELQDVAVVPKHISGSRRFLSLALIGAACLLVTLGWWARSLREVGHLSPANVALLWDRPPEAITSEKGLIKKVPRGWSAMNNVSVQDWKQSKLSNPPLTVSVRPFEFRFPRGTPEEGWLFVLPKSSWGPVPVSSVSRARVQYSPDRVWIVWGEGNLVYIVALAGSPQSLERLQHQLDGDQAVF